MSITQFIVLKNDEGKYFDGGRDEYGNLRFSDLRGAVLYGNMEDLPEDFLNKYERYTIETIIINT